MHSSTRRVLATLAAFAAASASVAALAPSAEAATACPTAKTSIIRSAPGSGKTIALTFDDGAGGVTPQVLGILRKYNVRATFFDTGAHDAKYPAEVAQISAEGHLIAEHTWEHQYPSSSNGHWSRSYLNSQFDKTNAQQLKLTGKNTCFWRPPGGFQTSGMVAEAAKNHMSTVMWSVDTNDWKQAGHTTKSSTNSIIKAAKTGYSQKHPIVLMHVSKASHESESKVSSNRSNDVAALPSIIKGYLDHGYRFVDLAGESGLNDRTTTLSMSTTSVNVPVGQQTSVVSATVKSVSGAVTDQPVRWYARAHGTSAWTYRGTVTTDSKGVARAVDSPSAPTDYTMKFDATSDYQASSTSAYRYVGTYAPPARPLPSTDGSTTTSSASCLDGGKVAWKSEVTWGQPYDVGGVLRVAVGFAGWTTTKTGQVPTDSTLKVYENGKKYRTQDRTALVDYHAGSFFDAQDPADPVSAPGTTKITVHLGVDGDGKAGCTTAFVQPSVTG